MSLASIPLRERKRARTRIALVEALLERLVERPLDAIQVAELVEAVDISPATFFNYFPSMACLFRVPSPPFRCNFSFSDGFVEYRIALFVLFLHCFD